MLKQFCLKAFATVAYLLLLSLNAAYAELPKGSRLSEPCLASGSPNHLLTKTLSERCWWLRETAANPCRNNRAN